MILAHDCSTFTNWIFCIIQRLILGVWETVEKGSLSNTSNLKSWRWHYEDNVKD